MKAASNIPQYTAITGGCTISVINHYFDIDQFSSDYLWGLFGDFSGHEFAALQCGQGVHDVILT